MIPVKPFDFAYVVKHKDADTPLNRGDLVHVMGHTLVPASSSDPYLKRVLVTVAATDEEGYPLVPGDNEHMSYIVDPRNLEYVGDNEQERLVKLIVDRKLGE